MTTCVEDYYPSSYLKQAVCTILDPSSCVCTNIYYQPTTYSSERYETNHEFYLDVLHSTRFAKEHNTTINITENDVERCLDKDPTIFDGVKLNIIEGE